MQRSLFGGGRYVLEIFSVKNIILHMFLCAGTVFIAGMLFGMGFIPLLHILVSAVTIIYLFYSTIHIALIRILRKLTVKKPIIRICSVLSAVFTILVSACTLIYFAQDSMIFHNVKDAESMEFLKDRSGYSEIAFINWEIGKIYQGVMYQATEEKAPLLIYFGGNGEVSYRHMRNREEQGAWEYFSGYNYLYIDYEGYGQNGGQTNYRNMYEQSLAVYDYAVTLPNVDSEQIVTMGYSLGTGSAVYLAAHRPVAGLILAAPYANGYDLYNGMLPIFVGPFKSLVKQKLPSDEYAPSVMCPALIIASRDDEMVPFASSERLSKLFSGSVEFVELNNVSHNGIFSEKDVYNKVQSFLESAALNTP